jgi:hypothetical protein
MDPSERQKAGVRLYAIFTVKAMLENWLEALKSNTSELNDSQKAAIQKRQQEILERFVRHVKNKEEWRLKQECQNHWDEVSTIATNMQRGDQVAGSSGSSQPGSRASSRAGSRPGSGHGSRASTPRSLSQSTRSPDLQAAIEDVEARLAAMQDLKIKFCKELNKYETPSPIQPNARQPRASSPSTDSVKHQKSILDDLLKALMCDKQLLGAKLKALNAMTATQMAVTGPTASKRNSPQFIQAPPGEYI